MQIAAIRVVVTSDAAQRRTKFLSRPTLDAFTDAVASLLAHVGCGGGASAWWVEMSYTDQGREETFTVIGGHGASPSAMAAEMWEELENFRY